MKTDLTAAQLMDPDTASSDPSETKPGNDAAAGDTTAYRYGAFICDTAAAAY